jgi:hypothetical protein
MPEISAGHRLLIAKVMKPIKSLSKARDELKLWVKRMRDDEYKSSKIQWSPSVEDCEELILAIETDLAWKGEWLLKNALAEIRNNELLGWKTVPVIESAISILKFCYVPSCCCDASN